MKVLIFTPYLSLSYGGTSKVVRETAESLAKLDDISVDLITTNVDNGKLLPVHTSQWILEKKVRIRYFQAWHRGDTIISLPLIRWFIKHAKNYDLVHTHTVFCPMVSCIGALCKLFKIPYLITPHGMLEPWALSHKTDKKKLYYSLIDKFSLECSHRIQAIASPELENIKNLGFKNSILVPNGLFVSKYLKLPSKDIFFQYFPQISDRELILFLGRVDPKKGLDLLAPAFSRFHSVFPDAHLVIAGPDLIDFTSTVRGYFDQLNCLDAVTFTGMLTGDLKYAALSAASLYVAPSYSEGFSMSILEAMAAGLPCIFTEGCNFPEAKAAEAAYVVPTDSQSIADALIQAFHNPKERQRIGDRAQKLILDHYTWEKAAQRLAINYKDVISQTL